MTPWIAPVARPTAWGRPRARYLTGLGLIMLGVAATVFTSTYSMFFLLIGPSLHLLGWLLMPGALWRRLVVLLPCLLAGLTLLGGPDFAGAFAVLLAGWLLVRNRPLVAYPVLLLPIGASFLIKAFLHGYAQNWVGDLVGTVTVIASAWLAWWLAGWPVGRRRGPGTGAGPGPAMIRAVEAGQVGETTRQIPSRSE